MKTALYLALPFLMLAGLTGCATNDPFNEPTPESVVLQQARDTADYFAKGLKSRLTEVVDGKKVVIREQVLVTSLVDVSDLHASSGFGRIFSEDLSGRLADDGIDVSDLKTGTQVRVIDGVSGSRSWSAGEFILTREIKGLAEQRGATAIVAGTYSVGDSEVIVNVKVLEPQSGRIVLAKSFTVPYSDGLFRRVVGAR